MFSGVMDANGGHPDMGKELRARFSDSGFVNVVATGALEAWGAPCEPATPRTIRVDVRWNHRCPGDLHGIVTKDECDAFQEATKVWKEDPGAFAAFAWGECLGLKP